ncbi:hypothetical protein RB195_023774 [Necator americanus]|uniref:Uncharacterized protein n=1 Tax=Necator americanus TaxID=51031 RepID=A0ABR1EKQ0_NECAM
MGVSSALLLRNKNDPFLNQIVPCDENWILYDNRRRSAQWLDSDEAPQHFPKPNLHKKGYGDCLVVCNRPHPAQLPEYWRNDYNGEVPTNRRNAPRTAAHLPGVGQQKGTNPAPRQRSPIRLTIDPRAEVERIGLLDSPPSTIVPYIRTSRLLTTTFSSISTTSFARNASGTEKMPKRPLTTLLRLRTP